MFRELIRKNKELSMEECVHILKTEKNAHRTLLLELTPEHICGKIVEES